MLMELKEVQRLPYKPKLTTDMLTYLRAARGLTQLEFAKRINIPQSSLSQLETGVLSITEHYEKAIQEGIAELSISSEEIAYINRIIAIRKSRGYM